MKEIKIETIKKALLDNSFRKLFSEFKDEINQWINNPDCKCNLPLYKAILSNENKLKEYFGNNITIPHQEELDQPEQFNRWTVINCSIDELQNHLDNLEHGPKQIAIARWEDQVTLIINDPIFN